MREAIQSIAVDQAGGDGSQRRTLDVLVAGAALPPNPGELIESHATLLGKVDGVIIVGRVGRNRRDVAERLRETLTGAGAPLLGVIANGFKAGGRGAYAYSYAYSYARDENAAAATGGFPPSQGSAAGSPNGSETPLRTGSPNE